MSADQFLIQDIKEVISNSLSIHVSKGTVHVFGKDPGPKDITEIIVELKFDGRVISTDRLELK